MNIKKYIKNLLGEKNTKKILEHKEKIKYYYYRIRNRDKDNRSLNILDFEETINKIVKEKKSVARYGDGEFKWILNIDQPGSFETTSEKLSKRLTEIIKEKNDNLMICIPYVLKNNNNYTWAAKAFWEKFVCKFYKQIEPYLNKKREYGNASISRCYMDYEDKSLCEDKFKLLKKIWENRNVIVVEGKNTKFGVNNDFLKDTKEVRRIICPNKNAFKKYEIILRECKKAPKDTLFLIALGPTATVLASDLSQYNYQAIDIGHADIEYEWYLNGATDKKEVLGKEVNESLKLNKNYEILEDEIYKKSIITKID